jgi:uncharacterized membrane protein HdeD (DUF308 family)
MSITQIIFAISIALLFVASSVVRVIMEENDKKKANQIHKIKDYDDTY